MTTQVYEVEMSVFLEMPTSQTDVTQTDEFFYGYRPILIENGQGPMIYDYRPLTLADFLDPEEGDVLMQGTLHHQDAGDLYSIFVYIHQHEPTTGVYGDMKITWGQPGLSNPVPDIAVIPNVNQPNKSRGQFEVEKEGTKPTFVLEVVSPRYRKADRVDKLDIYAKAGVQEYVIVDSWLTKQYQATGQKGYEVLGYRLEGGKYVPMEADEKGRIYSEVNGVWLGINEAGDEIEVIDGQTGEVILPASKRAEVEAARADTEAARADRAEAILRELGISLDDFEAM